jgi:hypothetical protein
MIIKVGFIACYKGHEIASSKDFGELTKTEKVAELLGNKDLVIKQTIPEDVVAVY